MQYRVWRGTSPDVTADSGTLVSGTEALTKTSFTDTSVTNGTTYYYIVRAVIPGESNSDSTEPVAATPNDQSAFVEKVNFQSKTADVPDGYLKDYGQAFGPRTGTDLSYGWLDQETTQPLSLVTNGRDRDLESNQLLDTLMHMQGADVPDFNGVSTNGRWEIAVPNGSYAVTVAVGDPGNYEDPEIHTINVEGKNAIDSFKTSGPQGSAGHHKTTTVNVTVNDGRLTLDAQRGTNTKIDYVDIAAAN